MAAAGEQLIEATGQVSLRRIGPTHGRIWLVCCQDDPCIVSIACATGRKSIILEYWRPTHLTAAKSASVRCSGLFSGLILTTSGLSTVTESKCAALHRSRKRLASSSTCSRVGGTELAASATSITIAANHFISRSLMPKVPLKCHFEHKSQRQIRGRLQNFGSWRNSHPSCL